MVAHERAERGCVVMRMRGALGVLALSAALVLGGCGGSGGSDSAVSTENQSYVSESEKNDVEFESGMFTYESDVSLSATDYDAAYDSLRDMVTKHGCVIQGSHQWSDDLGNGVESRSVSMTLRCPSENLSAFSEALRSGPWTVDNFSLSGASMESTYKDIDARIESSRSMLEWYEKQLEDIDDAEVALQYQEQMRSLLDEIESLEREKEDVETDVAWSQVSIYLTEEVDQSRIEGARMTGSWSVVGESLMTLPTRLIGALGWLAYVILMILPVLLIVAVIVVPIWLLSRRKKGDADASGEARAEAPVRTRTRRGRQDRSSGELVSVDEIVAEQDTNEDDGEATSVDAATSDDE